MAEILEAAGGLDPSQAVSLKTCSKCRETKPLGEFYKQASCADGHNSYCKPCVIAVRDAPSRLDARRANQRDASARRAGKVRPWQEMLASIGAP